MLRRYATVTTTRPVEGNPYVIVNNDAMAKSQIELVLRLMALPFPLPARAIKLLKSFVGNLAAVDVIERRIWLRVNGVCWDEDIQVQTVLWAITTRLNSGTCREERLSVHFAAGWGPLLYHKYYNYRYYGNMHTDEHTSNHNSLNWSATSIFFKLYDNRRSEEQQMESLSKLQASITVVKFPIFPVPWIGPNNKVITSERFTRRRLSPIRK